jgi:hypothetical protein
MADTVTDWFPIAQRFQSFSYGPAVAPSGGGQLWQVSLTRERTERPMFKLQSANGSG